MDTNYWYYTLSAIPQTLAAMIALAATFVVFKLNFLSEKIKDSRIDLRRFTLLLTSFQKKEIHDIEPLDDEKFIELFEEALKNVKSNEDKLGLDHGIYQRLKKELGRIIQEDWKSNYPARNYRINGYLQMKRNIFRSLLSIKKMSLWLLSLSLLVTTLTIIASLFALPHYQLFSHPDLIVSIILISSTLSVLLTAFSVWKIAKS